MQDRIFLGLSLRRRLIHIAWAVYYLVSVLTAHYCAVLGTLLVLSHKSARSVGKPRAFCRKSTSPIDASLVHLFQKVHAVPDHRSSLHTT